MLSDLIDNTIERQYILMSDTLNILEILQHARSNNNVLLRTTCNFSQQIKSIL